MKKVIVIPATIEETELELEINKVLEQNINKQTIVHFNMCSDKHNIVFSALVEIEDNDVEVQ